MITVKQLIERHPKLLSNVYCGISLGDGWCPIVDRLCYTIEQYCERNKVALPVVAQIKEKFGGLRFYVDDLVKELHPLISFVEGLSFTICETCSNNGKLRNDLSWIRTLCDEHYNALGRKST